jgi:phosphoglycerol transferase MdoB-like AlkP superfamily enzyme
VKKYFSLENVHINLILKLGVVLVFLEFYRILLLISNSKSFVYFGIYEHLVGIWFDIITIALYFFPFIFFYFLPIGSKLEKVRKWFLLILFGLTTTLIFFFNSWDVAYFSYTEKRTTFDYLKYLLNNTETVTLAGDFIQEFSWLIIIFISSSFGLVYLFFKLNSPSLHFKKLSSWMSFFLAMLVTFTIGRGGFQLKPIGILESTNYSSIKNSQAILNSAFIVLKTIHLVGIEPKNYYNEDQANQIFNPIQQTRPQGILRGKPNVLFILFESFGTMYSGPASPESYTPFLDSILNKSMYFDYGISNSRTSMEALPTVVSSIPTWMNECFILSSYNSNQFEGLPGILKEDGYVSAFFHGSTNGSMRFNSFASAVGFDYYYGRSEYNNDKHFNGNWGIDDHYFMSWAIDQINEIKRPFFSMIFTISSHHPFTIPNEFKNKVRNGPDPICKSIHYADLAFKSFWEKAQKQDWFKNTLFIFSADHVGPTNRSDRTSLEWLHRIPIAFYHASGKLPKIKSGTPFQQIDILPTALDLLNQKRKFFSFGNSYFSNTKFPKMAYCSENLIAFEKGKEPFEWNDHRNRRWNRKKQSQIKVMKAIYQQYTKALIENKMMP